MPWSKRVVVVVIALIAWFALLHPLVPSSVSGLVIEVLAGLVAFGLLYGGIRAVVWLQTLTGHRALVVCASVVIALAVGGGIFVSAYVCRTYWAGSFTYLHW